MEDQPSFQFGVEIELLLGSRKKQHVNWKSLAKDLSKRLQKAGIANHVNESNDKSPDNYREWSIVQEVTIPSQPAKSLCISPPLPPLPLAHCCPVMLTITAVGLELVSPIYPVYSYWGADLQTIFSVLHTHYTLHPSDHCSTHVHISGTPSPFSPLELASLSKAILYHESSLDMAFPPARRSAAYWCQSNRTNPALAPFPLSACLSALDSAAGTPTDLRPVVELMNLFPASSAYGRSHAKKRDFIRGKVYKWDLTGVLSPERGDVEFRQAPGSLSAEQAAGWITLAVAFVAGAAGGRGMGLGGHGVVDEDGGSGEELWALLQAGAAAVGWEGLGGAETLFEGN
ncbi:putative amidoligase enzyme-domain-containing protein [Coniochaeta sp. 2T2.1]|nr:putative amidoligase enzyme-domain-containing protein [Coniochaeta sp. 2T2.1]